MSRYCIVSDLDGTLYDKTASVAPSNIPAIKKFISDGNYFTVATGRANDYVQKLAYLCNAPAITSNGACLYSPKEDKTISDKSFVCRESYKICQQIHELFPDVRIRHTDDDGIHYLFTGEEENLDKRWYKIVIEAANHSELDTPYKRYELACIEKWLYENYPDRFIYLFSSEHLFEMLQIGALKGDAIADLKRYFAENGEDVKIVAIGDYENDREMLIAADIPACPCNSLPDIVSLVTSRGGIVTASNNDGAVASLIEQLALLDNGDENIITDTESDSAEKTEQIGFELAQQLSDGKEDVDKPYFVAFYGDLGAGKTAFIRGMAKCLAPLDDVSSPTYSIINAYLGDNYFYHLDLYRITSEDDLFSVGFYELFDDKKCVIAAEWCENIPYALPDSYIKVTIARKDDDENKRHIKIEKVYSKRK